MWVVIFSFKGSSWSKDQTCISWLSCIVRQVLYHWAPWGALRIYVTAVLSHVIGSRSALWKRTLFPRQVWTVGIALPTVFSISSTCFCWLSRPCAQISDQSPRAPSCRAPGVPVHSPALPSVAPLSLLSVPWAHWLSLVSLPCSAVWKRPWSSHGDWLFTPRLSRTVLLWCHLFLSDNLVSCVLSDFLVAYRERVNPALVIPYSLGGKVNKLF